MLGKLIPPYEGVDKLLLWWTVRHNCTQTNLFIQNTN